MAGFFVPKNGPVHGLLKLPKRGSHRSPDGLPNFEIFGPVGLLVSHKFEPQED